MFSLIHYAILVYVTPYLVWVMALFVTPTDDGVKKMHENNVRSEGMIDHFQKFPSIQESVLKLMQG